MEFYSILALVALILSVINMIFITKKEWVSQSFLGLAFICMGLKSLTTTDDPWRISLDFTAAAAAFFWALFSYRKSKK